MDNKQESHLNMQMTTANFCDGNSTTVSSLPAYSTNLQILVESNNQIEEAAESQGTGTGGITSNKKQLRLSLNASASDTARKLISFAKLTNNYTLLGEVNYSESDFKIFSDNEVREKSQVLYNKAQEHISELTEYGITEETQTTLQNNIISFSEVIVAPRMGITNKSQATKQLVDLFKRAATALEKMDAAVEIVKLTEPIFYDGYKSARKIISKGTRKLAVKGLVIENENGEPIKGVTVTFTLNDATDQLKAASSEGQAELTKTTAAKGGFNIKSLAAGIYKASFKKMGYVEQLVTVNVNDGEITVVEVKLSKN